MVGSGQLVMVVVGSVLVEVDSSMVAVVVDNGWVADSNRDGKDFLQPDN